MATPGTQGDIQDSIARVGLIEVYHPVGDALVDIVFVHGLNGHPYNTWTSERDKTFWPAQLLPAFLKEQKARILVYGYDASVFSFFDGTSREIHDNALGLVTELVANRQIRRIVKRPIIFIAHSLGGLLVKNALVWSSEIRGEYTERLRSVYISTYGILFLGTPNWSIDLASWGSMLERVGISVLQGRLLDTLRQRSKHLNRLKIQNEALQAIDRSFILIASRFHLYCFHEGKPTSLEGRPHVVVDEQSASPKLADVERAAIHADHTHICKFDADGDPGFELVVEGLQRYAESAPETVAGRWKLEEEERFMKKEAVRRTEAEDDLVSLSSIPLSGRGLDSGAQPYLPRNRGPKSPDDGIPSFVGYGHESLSNNPEMKDVADKLTSFLLEDEKLQHLFMKAFQEDEASVRSINRLRVLLQKFGTELRKEALNPGQEAAAALAKANAKYVAYKIREWYQYKDKPKKFSRIEILLVNAGQPTLDTDDTDQQDSVSDSEEANDDEDFNADTGFGLGRHSKLSLEELKDFMTSSEAFSRFQNAFRRMVYPNPCVAIHDLVSRAYNFESSNCTAEFHLEWEVAKYIESELWYDEIRNDHHDDHLHPVLIINGTSSRAYAATAADYIRWKWPRSSWNLLDAIEGKLGSRSKGVGVEERTDLNFHFEEFSGAATLTINARSLGELIEIAQQLVWLSASFRLPKYGQVSYSEALLEQTATKRFRIKLLDLEPIRQRSHTCWLPLFENGIVARGFPIPARKGEEGIELPFSVMTGLANIMYPILHDQRIYLRGFSRLLFPTAVSPDLRCVQWHLMTSSNPRERLPPGTLPAKTSECSWVEVSDFESLASAQRTFLGYCKKIDVHLGTNGANYEAVQGSGADDEEPAPGATPKSMSTGTSGLGIWGFQVNMDIVLSKGLFATTQPGWYIDLMDLAKDTPIIVYDNAEKTKRAWLVPTLSVVLHMAHIWARDKDDLLKPIPFASLQWDCGPGAAKVIRAHSRDELRDAREGDKKYLLSDLIGRILVSLDKLIETEAIAKSGPGRAIKAETSKLYGWDLLEVAKGKKIINRKQLKVSEEWMALGTDRLVLFCKDFGDIIQPIADMKLCSWGNLANHGSNYLTATVKCLQYLSIERGGSPQSTCLRLSNQAYWLCPEKEQFDDCKQCLFDSHSKRSKCLKRPQQIISNHPPSRKDCSLPPIEGAVSFGKRKLQKDTAISKATFNHPLATAGDIVMTGAVDDGRSQAIAMPVDNSIAAGIQMDEDVDDGLSRPQKKGRPDSSETPEPSETTDASSDKMSNPSLDTSVGSSNELHPQDMQSSIDSMGRLQVSNDAPKPARNKLQKKPKSDRTVS